jgi:isopenicillin N synthase-like dioxygenase
VVDKYGKSVFELFTLLMELISVGMALEPDAIAKQASINRGAAIRTDFNCYPPCPQPDLVLGSAPHADRSILTVLQQNEVSGLEVFKDGEWFRVAPMKNAFVINLGDQMQVCQLPTPKSQNLKI